MLREGQWTMYKLASIEGLPDLLSAKRFLNIVGSEFGVLSDNVTTYLDVTEFLMVNEFVRILMKRALTLHNMMTQVRHGYVPGAP